MIKKYNVDVISLGNGTASRESEEVNCWNNKWNKEWNR